MAVGSNYDANGTFVPEETHIFAEAGSCSVTMRVEKGGQPTSDYTKTVTVRSIAAFDRDPPYSAVLLTGQHATFTSESVAWSGETITSLKWDVDGDGFDDGTGEVLTTSFATPGNKTLRLEVVQSDGERDVATRIFRVNAPPVASFIWAPGTPVADSAVQLYSTSVDAEGPLASQAWDVDGDGQFDDASGASATHSFTAGHHNVSLRVVNADGVSRTATRTVTVATPPITPPPPAATVKPAPPRLMNPFPTVRLAGLIVPRGVRDTLIGPRRAAWRTRDRALHWRQLSVPLAAADCRDGVGAVHGVQAPARGGGAHPRLRPCSGRYQQVRRVSGPRGKAVAPRGQVSDAGRLSAHAMHVSSPCRRH